MRKSLVLFGCLAVIVAPEFVGTASANNTGNGMNAANTITMTSDYGNTASNSGGSEYVVNPTEVTSTRDNRGDIPEGARPSNPHYNRSYDGNANGGNPNWNNPNPAYNPTR